MTTELMASTSSSVDSIWQLWQKLQCQRSFSKFSKPAVSLHRSEPGQLF
jgi:hypothetical protein